MKNSESRRRRIEEEVQKTLHALDDLEPVKANPAFYARLMQRLDQASAPPKRSGSTALIVGKLRPALIPVLMAGSVLLGILIGYKPKEQSRTEALETLATAYGLQVQDLSEESLTGRDN